MNASNASVESLLTESVEELYEDAPCGYISTLPDGTIIRVNRTFLSWTGYTRDAILAGKRLQDLLPVPAKVYYETHYTPLLRLQGFVREIALDLVCANKRLLPVLVNAAEHQDAAGLSIVRTTIFDATERRAYERELLSERRRAEQLAAVVQASGDAIVITTPDGIVQTWNSGAEQLFGHAAAEARGRQIRELILQPEDEEYDRAIGQVRTGREVQMETLLLHQGGHRIYVSLSLTPHLEPPGEVVAISSIMRDITEPRRLEKQLRQAEQLLSVGTLAGGVAHEVNNQMTVVLGFGEFVLREIGADHPQARDVQHMVTAAGRAARVSQQLLAFSRRQLMMPEEFDLGALIMELAPTLSRLLGTGNTLVIGPDLPEARVSADRSQIGRVISHLTMNARDAMAEEGQLRIEVEHTRLTEEDAHLHAGDEVAPGPYVLLTVSDTGGGMDEDTLRRAFEPFFTTKELGQSSGLGLPMVYGIVKQHGGQVWAASKPGQGTRIQVYLPALRR